MTYDGSGKAGGVKVYVNGQPQRDDVQADKLQEHDPHDVPLKIGQRQHASAAGRRRSRICGSTAARLPPRRYSARSRPARGWLTGGQAGRPAERGREERTVRAGGWTAMDSRTGKRPPSWPRWNRSRRRSKRAARSPTCMKERNEPPMAFVLFRGEYDKRRDQVAARHAAIFLPPMPAGAAAEPPGLRPVAAAAGAPADRARHGQPLLAGAVRHRASCGRPTTSASPASCRRIRNCSTGWPSSSATRLGREDDSSSCWSRRRPTGRRPSPRRRNWRRTRKPPAVARAAVPHGRRDDPRLRAGRQRPAGAEDRRAEREAVPAGRRVGSGGHARQQHPRLQAGHGREPLPPQPVHVLETGRPAGVDGDLQRAQPRECARCAASGRTRRCRRW